MKSSASTKPGGTPSTSRTAHPARANTSGNAGTSGKRPQGPRTPVHAKGKTERRGAAAQAKESEKVTHTVIITNVENDFGKLHRACLPYYCSLRSDYEETLDVERLVHEGGPQSRRLIGAVRGCSYAVRCRTETRSAEISLYGPANADFAPMKLTKTSRRPSTPAADSKSTAAPTASSSAKLAEKDTTAPAEDVSEATALANVGAVEQLALWLRRQHYFEEHLPVSVHLPGRQADEVLLRIDKGSAPGGAGGTDVTGVKSEEANGVAEDADADRRGSAATPATVPASRKKRQRVDEEDRNAGAPSLQRVKTEAPDGDEEGMEEDGATAHERGKTTEDGVDQEADNGGRRSRRLTKSKSATIIKQFPRRQKDFVTAVAALSSRVPLQRVRGRLRDLPGFLSCWSLYERHLRVVFLDAESLFKAKQLLDQFELEPGLRVSLIFSDPLSRTNAEYVRTQENESVNE
ncbi:conserved hypothetical protein [Leishmania infantum JPCM5]|uniref:Uncharacterized protein n=2 Tax=Leishmania infantum TaxID=5671 RepID=A4HVM8_LEIIN|nr:conserved hypothetical protein [Leishmania infantum JPCM5]CAC9466088.1 hypothetical_protein_-_conserved [Leishmania infantum]CAM66495.1 conserved hypothetical protein [Leishmania infantum JPCM5]SUZ40149.1 hypothetical_protein_-_conserved [Leishmania infantum]|eukprot:XP_001464119.1 conserved hypothetical protein [Leishmania infantum JPCM5]